MASSLFLGLLFLLVGFASVFLMFHLWGYPFDKATRTSAAPRSLMLLHRALGYVYVIIYVVMMWKMVPRLWEYQVELPARTVAHLSFGMLIGVLLLVKLAILRFFRHLEEWMPVLGVSLLMCTILLSGLSLPFGLRELSLARSAGGAGVYSPENLERLAKLLPQAELPAEVSLEDLATPGSLATGREVLAGKCVVCHDLKTILTQPRTPPGWWKTVERMANKPTFHEPLTERELHVVTAYLIAISSDLQRSVKERRKEEKRRDLAVSEVKQDKSVAPEDASAGSDLPPFDAVAAAKTYETLCGQCHELAEIEAKPPADSEEVKNVIIRMLSDNGMEATKEQLDLVYMHMVQKYAGGKVIAAGPARPAAAPTAAAPEAAPEAAPSEAVALDGGPLYARHCKGCHALDGKGSAGMKASNIPDMSDPAWQASNDQAKVAEAIERGVEGTKMKAFKSKLSAEEISAVAAYVKRL